MAQELGSSPSSTNLSREAVDSTSASASASPTRAPQLSPLSSWTPHLRRAVLAGATVDVVAPLSRLPTKATLAEALSSCAVQGQVTLVYTKLSVHSPRFAVLVQEILRSRSSTTVADPAASEFRSAAGGLMFAVSDSPFSILNSKHAAGLFVISDVVGHLSQILGDVPACVLTCVLTLASAAGGEGGGFKIAEIAMRLEPAGN